MNAFKHTLLIAAGIGLISATSLVQAQETPAAAPAGVKLIDAAAVQAMQGKGAVLVDTRKTSEFSDGTIKGAISVPYDPEKSAKDVKFDASQDKFDMSKIADKNKDYIVFCNSGTCWKSYKAAVVMSKAGYKNVHWYRNGFPDWKARKLPTE